MAATYGDSGMISSALSKTKAVVINRGEHEMNTAALALSNLGIEQRIGVRIVVPGKDAR